MNVITQNIIIQYLQWHFSDVPNGILKAWKNYLIFIMNYFSIPLLIKTLFSNWRRYSVSYGRGFSFTVFFEAFFGNMIFRILGAMMRTILIIVGTVTEAFVLVAGFVIFCAWFILPLIILTGFLFGITLLF